VVIPIYDKDPLESNAVPFVTYGLIALNVLIFFYQLTLSPGADEQFAEAAGFIPAAFFHDPGFAGTLPILTYMFVHGGWEHVIGNMLFLWVFGDNIEDAVGHGRFLAFYLACGFCAALVHGLLDTDSLVPLVGASGAIAGIVAAYLMLRPCAKVEVLIFFIIPRAIDAYWVLGFWVLLQIWEIVKHAADGVAWWAHIGGLGAGAQLILFMRKPGIELFACVEPVEEPSAIA
jgi:membrane associated rhomboid family serine protease